MNPASSLRLLVRSLLRESSVPGVLAPGVTPELFVESFRKFWGVVVPFVPIGDSPYDEVRIKNLISAGLNEEQARAVFDMVVMCTVPGDEPDYNVRTIIHPIFKTLGYKDDPAKVQKLWEQIQREFEIDPLARSEWHVVSLVCARALSAWSVDGLSRDLQVMQNLSADTLERRINFMDSMYAFLEPKDLDRRTRQKLMSMVREGVDGMMQAAELYRMM